MVMNVVHIGLPKTASTTLQDRLFAPQRRFIYVGRIENGYRDAETRELFERITFQDSLAYDAGTTELLVQSLRAKAAAPARPMLVSSESLSVEGRADRRLIAERLHKLFAPAKILIVLRAQPAMLQSLYLNHLRGSGQRMIGFDQWLEETYGGVRFTELQRIGLDYESLVRVYEDIFGADHVVVVPFEQIKDGASGFFRALAGLLDVSAAEVHACLNANTENQRMSRRQLLALRIQDMLPRGTNLALLGRRLLPLSVYEPMRRFVTGGARARSPQLPEHWRKRIAETCGPANLRLASRKNIPLAMLGYPIAPDPRRQSDADAGLLTQVQ